MSAFKRLQTRRNNREVSEHWRAMEKESARLNRNLQKWRAGKWYKSTSEEELANVVVLSSSDEDPPEQPEESQTPGAQEAPGYNVNDTK